MLWLHIVFLHKPSIATVEQNLQQSPKIFFDFLAAFREEKTQPADGQGGRIDDRWSKRLLSSRRRHPLSNGAIDRMGATGADAAAPETLCQSML
jgi:hypothetical protein